MRPHLQLINDHGDPFAGKQLCAGQAATAVLAQVPAVQETASMHRGARTAQTTAPLHQESKRAAIPALHASMHEPESAGCGTAWRGGASRGPLPTSVPPSPMLPPGHSLRSCPRRLRLKFCTRCFQNATLLRTGPCALRAVADRQPARRRRTHCTLQLPLREETQRQIDPQVLQLSACCGQIPAAATLPLCVFAPTLVLPVGELSQLLVFGFDHTSTSCAGSRTPIWRGQRRSRRTRCWRTSDGSDSTGTKVRGYPHNRPKLA